MRTIILLFLFAFGFPLLANSQEKTSLPYKGGSIQFDKDVESSLIVEASGLGRVYFVELFYSKDKKGIDFIVHGQKENDVTAKCVLIFFNSSKDKWDKSFLKKSNILIPLFISPEKADYPSNFEDANMNEFAEIISNSFASKKCYLYKPLYKFRQMVHIDIEPEQNKNR